MQGMKQKRRERLREEEKKREKIIFSPRIFFTLTCEEVGKTFSRC